MLSNQRVNTWHMGPSIHIGRMRRIFKPGG